MKNTKQIALGGIIAGLSLVCMMLSAVFPMAEYACPALAGIFLVALVIEFNKKTATIAYVAVGLLSLIILANKESAILFIGFLGYYPIIKSVFEQRRSRAVEMLLKFGLFNMAVILSYFVMVNLLGMAIFTENMGNFYYIALFGLLAVANVTFFIYDIALTRLISMYITKIKPRFKL